MLPLLAAALLSACGLQDLGGGAGLALPDEVYLCTTATNQVEVCWGRDVTDLEDELRATCEPTPRHLGPCLYCCGPTCGAHGCNALEGCYCP